MKAQYLNRTKKKTDEKLLKANTIAQIGIVTVMVILLLMVWPFRVFKHSVISEYGDAVLSETGAITMEEIVLQPFIPVNNHIADMEISVHAYQVHGQDRVFVTIYNDVYEQVWQEVVYFTDIEALGFLRIEPELDVEIGQTYYIGMNVHFDSEGILTADYGSIQELSLPENTSFAYGGTTYEGMAVPVKYHYTAPWSKWRMAACAAGIIAAGAALYFVAAALLWLFYSLEAAKKRFVKRVSLLFAEILFYGFTGYAFYKLCIDRMFGGMALDLAIYGAACLILAVGAGLVLWRLISSEEKLAEEDSVRRAYAVPRGDTGNPRKTEKQSQTEKCRRPNKYADWAVWRNYLQTAAFVFLLYAGIMYVNATVQWKQDLNGAWVLLLFGAAVAVSFGKKDLFHFSNLIWGILMIPAGMAYCRLHAGEDHGGQIGAVFMTAVFFWGIVLIRTLRRRMITGMKNLCLPVGILWILLCAGMVLTGHGKSWPVFMAVTFTLFFLQYDSDETCKRVIRNFANAVMANFVLVLILCLLYRPYEYYNFNRYPMWFHTVASTGMYLALAEAVALVRLFIRMRDTGTVFAGCVKEWLLHSVIIAYIAFTVARTALMSVIGIMVVMAVGAAIVYRPAVKRYLQVFFLLVLMLVLSIPVCYTATRCIPAVVNRPYFVAEDLEDFKDAVKEGDSPDSNKYMNYKALMRLWGARLGLPEFLTRPFADDVYTEEVSVLARPQEIYLASAQDNGSWEAEKSAEDQTSRADELSNGRISIFKTYLSELNFTGHDSMVYVCEDGSAIAHAHNTYIQIAYDFGIPVGLLYLALCLLVILRAVAAIWKGYDRSEAMYLSLTVSCAFLITGVSEYAGNPNMPLCFAYLFLLLTMRMGKNMVK